MKNKIGYLYIFIAIVFTVSGQLITKWRMGLKGELPYGFVEKIFFLLKLFGDPWIISGFFSGFLAALAWMATLTKFDLSFAYPFMSLSFVLTFLFSIFLFNEPATFYKILGLVLICLGIFLSSK